ncbi:EF hand calcium-binding family protein [Rhynchospora pubera]|uniref:EF hand calcium-binding family protein n=1 Tax=Rhynchospora pubera TaxID=906938 RepID=A0AAV8FKD6_9POAL|nr:EF hand calcium-binding family protein [Rhynchospora pubera]
MAVKTLKKNAPAAADPCTTSPKTSTSPSKFSQVFTKIVPFVSKHRRDSDKEEPNSPPPPTIKVGQSKSCELQRIFCYFDENGDGKISPSELRNCMRATGEELSSAEAEEAVRFSDSDGDGELDLGDFVKLVESEDEQAKDKSLMDAFRMYEMDGRGCITPKSLRRMLRRLGEDRTVEDCTAMIGQFDLNGDGVLNFEEFKIMMQ